MSHWGQDAGLSVADILFAVKDNLFKDIVGPRGPLLRFAVSQGPHRRDPIMIKVAHPRNT